jgi:hypothetical protein
LARRPKPQHYEDLEREPLEEQARPVLQRGAPIQEYELLRASYEEDLLAWLLPLLLKKNKKTVKAGVAYFFS